MILDLFETDRIRKNGSRPNQIEADNHMETFDETITGKQHETLFTLGQRLGMPPFIKSRWVSLG